MAESASAPESLEARHHFLLRKIHSLTGIVPIGVFLIEHLLTNSMAWLEGPEGFNKHVKFLHELPYLPVLEVVGIFLPLAFHALYGIRIAMTAKHNVAQYPYMGNQRYTLQRVTGYVAFLFIVVHLIKFRFAHWFGGVPFLDAGIEDKFEITRRGLMEWVLPPGVTITMYVVGLLAACYHFANGIYTFCISWGITVGERAQKRVSIVAASLGVVLFFWGAVSLYAFGTADKKFLKGWDDRDKIGALAEDVESAEHGATDANRQSSAISH